MVFKNLKPVSFEEVFWYVHNMEYNYRVSVMSSINIAALQSNNCYVHGSQLPAVYNVQYKESGIKVNEL